MHLTALKNEGYFLDIWSDARIRAGHSWKEDIEKALAEAVIAILVISADFLASNFIIENELPPLLEAAKEKGTRIIPLIVSPCRFIQNKHLSTFQSINDPKDEILSDLTKTRQESIFVRLANAIEVDIIDTSKPDTAQ